MDTYKEEAVTTVRAVTKQRVIEALAASDCCSDQQAAALEVGGLSLAERLTLLHNAIQSLTFLLMRVKVYIGIILLELFCSKIEYFDTKCNPF